MARAVRKHYSFTPETHQMILELQAATGANSESEVLRRALAFYDVACRKVREDKMIIARDQGPVNHGEERLTVPTVVFK